MKARPNISFIGLLAAALICIVLPWRADACSISLSTVQVPPNFRVVVQHGTAPVPGIKLEVYDYADLQRKSDDEEWKPIQMLATGSDGAVEIHNLPPGHYLVETTGPGAGSAVMAEVSPKQQKRTNQIELEWPYSREIVEASTLNGELASNNPWTPFENIHLELWAAGAHEPLAVQDTGAGGHFHFAEAKSGIYILRIRGQQKRVDVNSRVEGDIAIELLPAAADSPDPLALYLGMTSCGITYSRCPDSNNHMMPSRRLQVLDPLGAIISNAKYRVIDASGTEAATGSTGSDGMVELSLELNGKVTLIVTNSSPTIFTLPLDLIPPTDTAKYLVVAMQVEGFGGSRCNAATLEKHAPQK
jgi:hypothetical protein